jgi:hypothetical protein
MPITAPAASSFLSMIVNRINPPDAFAISATRGAKLMPLSDVQQI